MPSKELAKEKPFEVGMSSGLKSGGAIAAGDWQAVFDVPFLCVPLVSNSSLFTLNSGSDDGYLRLK